MMKRGEQGFTLVEVLISMAIFSFGILAIINMQLLSTAINVKSRGMTEGIVTAQNKIEELQSLPFNDAELADTDANGAAGLDIFPATDAVADNADHTDAVTNPRYTVFWNVENDTPFTGTKTVRVIVRWNSKGVFQNFSIDMVKSDGA